MHCEDCGVEVGLVEWSADLSRCADCYATAYTMTVDPRDTEIAQLRADLARAEATIAKLREAMPTNEEMPILKRLHRYHWKRATDGGKHPPKSAAEEVDLLDVGRILDRLDAAKEGR